MYAFLCKLITKLLSPPLSRVNAMFVQTSALQMWTEIARVEDK